MNTDSNQPSESEVQSSIGRDVINALDGRTLHMPIQQLLQELQLVVERMTFGSEGREVNSLMKSEIDSLLEGDVSSEVVSFVRWLHDKRIAALLVGRSGRHFLTFCLKYYKTIREVRCITPIKLSDTFRDSMTSQLRQLYPAPQRIIFQVSPAIMAGCIIDNGDSRTDMSLGDKSPALVHLYVVEKQEASGGAVHE